MAAGDDIFVRLRKATDAELSSIQNYLQIKTTGDREADIVPVSYTHLDVYKRQHLRHRGPQGESGARDDPFHTLGLN